MKFLQNEVGGTGEFKVLQDPEIILTENEEVSKKQLEKRSAWLGAALSR